MHCEAFFVFLTNRAFGHMKTFTTLSTSSTYRTAVIGDGLQDYLLKGVQCSIPSRSMLQFNDVSVLGYRSSVQDIGDQRIDDPWDQMYEQTSSFRSFISSIIPDLPMVRFFWIIHCSTYGVYMLCSDPVRPSNDSIPRNYSSQVVYSIGHYYNQH